MWFNILLLLVLCTFVEPSDDNDEPVLYYYGLGRTSATKYSISLALLSPMGIEELNEMGYPCPVGNTQTWRTGPENTCWTNPTRAVIVLMIFYPQKQKEESERSLPSCNPRQACSALILRYWRAPALVRLCRCARRMRCDTRASNDSFVELNNRAHLQFCQPVTDWPMCGLNDSALNVITTYQRMNPDELEEMHHMNMQLVPPNITFSCRCRNPNYWKLISSNDTNHRYRCSSLQLCKTGEFCGNVNYDLNALYQSCLCPRHHICVHNGGITHTHISELLYEGAGWRAYCQRITDDYSYEDY